MPYKSVSQIAQKTQKYILLVSARENVIGSISKPGKISLMKWVVHIHHLLNA